MSHNPFVPEFSMFAVAFPKHSSRSRVNFHVSNEFPLLRKVFSFSTLSSREFKNILFGKTVGSDDQFLFYQIWFGLDPLSTAPLTNLSSFALFGDLLFFSDCEYEFALFLNCLSWVWFLCAMFSGDLLFSFFRKGELPDKNFKVCVFLTTPREELKLSTRRVLE